jgi:hypothetical protein
MIRESIECQILLIFPSFLFTFNTSFQFFIWILALGKIMEFK